MPKAPLPKHPSKKQRRKAASANIDREISSGKYPRKQAIAIGLSEAGLSKSKSKHKKGR